LVEQREEMEVKLERDNIKDLALVEVSEGPFWRLNKILVREIGIEESLLFSELIFQYRKFSKIGRLDDEGLFYRTQKFLQEETMLSIERQASILKKLKDIGLIETKRKGLPSRYYYRINFDVYARILATGTDVEEQEEHYYEKEGSSVLDDIDTSIRDFRNTSIPILIDTINKKESNLEGINKTSPKGDVYEPDGSGATSFDNPPNDKPILRRRQIPLSEKPPFVPEDLKEVLTLWNNSGLRKHLDPTSKVYKEGVHGLKKLKRGVFFYDKPVANGYQERKFTKEEIIRAIENLKLAALNPDYEPTGGYKDYLKRLSLSDFLYNPYTQNGEKSLFIKYFESPPKLCSENIRMVKDHYPEYTKAVTGIYISRVKGGIGKLTQREQAKLIHAGKEIHDFFEENKKRIDPMYIRTIKAKVEMVFDGLIDHYKDSIQVGNLCSQYTYDTLLPIYLERQAVLI